MDKDKKSIDRCHFIQEEEEERDTEATREGHPTKQWRGHAQAKEEEAKPMRSRLSRRIQRRRASKRRRKVLRAHVASERRHMSRADQLIGNCCDHLEKQYGFVSDERQPLWERVEQRIGDIDVSKLCAQPANMACHNLLQHNPMPSGTTKLLGLGLNYCIRSTSTRETTKHTFTRLAEDVRRIYALRDVENDEGNYIPSLYN